MPYCGHNIDTPSRLIVCGISRLPAIASLIIFIGSILASPHSFEYIIFLAILILVEALICLFISIIVIFISEKFKLSNVRIALLICITIISLFYCIILIDSLTATSSDLQNFLHNEMIFNNAIPY